MINIKHDFVFFFNHTYTEIACCNIKLFFFLLRFWVYFQCLMLDVIPDPANSKWAKECTREKVKQIYKVVNY